MQKFFSALLWFSQHQFDGQDVLLFIIKKSKLCEYFVLMNF